MQVSHEDEDDSYWSEEDHELLLQGLSSNLSRDFGSWSYAERELEW